MNWYRKYPLFALGLTACGVVAAVELALIYERFDASREAARRLEQCKVELEGMAQLLPPPTRAVATAIEADLAKAQKALAAMQGELTGRGPAAERIRRAKLPAARTDSFFDLATFVEKMRELAEKNGVELRAEAARFGFSRYANEGPETDRIEPIFRQRQIAEYLLESLLAARPRVLSSVKRERALTKAEREARAAALASGQPVDTAAADVPADSPDYFVIDPRVSARVRDYVDTTAFRFVFIGQTATLRTFLNRLAAFDLPVLVREVEVEVATAEDTLAPPSGEAPAAPAALASDSEAAASVVLTTDSAASKAGAAKTAKSAAVRPPRTLISAPIVSKAFSKYTVTVEFVELVPTSAAPAEGQPAPTTS